MNSLTGKHKRVPFSVAIRAYESGRGYLLRAADQLEYSGPCVIKELAGISYSGPSESHALRKLATFLRLDLAILYDRFYIAADQIESSPYVPFLGQMVHGAFISRGNSKVCPKCLAAGQSAEAIWDLGLVTACSIHECQLVETCHHCRKPLSWLRPRLFRCACGADLRTSETLKAGQSEIAVTALIKSASQGFGELPSQNFGYCAALYECSLQNILHIIEFIGAKFYRFLNDFSASYRRRSDLVETRRIVTQAHKILSDWPNNFHDGLRKIDAKAKGGADTNDVYGRAFEAFHRYRFPKDSGLDFVKTEFIKFCGAVGNRPLRVIGPTTEEELVHQTWLTPPQAAAMIGKISPTVFQNIAQMGFLKIKVEADGRRRRGIWVDRESIANWIEDSQNWISSKEAEALLGMSRNLMLKLSESSLLETRRGGVYGLLETRNFQKIDVEKIAAVFQSFDVPVIESPSDANWVVLKKYGGSVNEKKCALKMVLDAVIKGTLKPVAKIGKGARVLDYVFERAALEEISQDLHGLKRATVISRSEVETLLATSQDIIDALIYEGVLVPLPRLGKCTKQFFVKREVLEFNKANILASQLATGLGTQSTWLRKYLSSLGVDGKTIKYRYATTMLYRKDDIRQHIDSLTTIFSGKFSVEQYRRLAI